MWKPEQVVLNDCLGHELKKIYIENKALIDSATYYRQEEMKKKIGKKQGSIYYIKIIKDNKIYYKAGYTRFNVFRRFERYDLTGFKIEVLQIVNIKNGYLAWRLEQYIHNKFKLYRITTPIMKDGNTEIYDRDILGYGNKDKYAEFYWDTGKLIYRDARFIRNSKKW